MDKYKINRPAEILLVEDNINDNLLTEQIIKNSEILNNFYVVKDGVAAMDFLYKRGEYENVPLPDIIFLDLSIPLKDGYEVLQEIKYNEDLNLKSIPVIVLSNSEKKADVDRAYDLYANAYIFKPIEPEEFLNAMKCIKQYWLEISILPTSDVFQK